jgi:hypothetical protein
MQVVLGLAYRERCSTFKLSGLVYTKTLKRDGVMKRTLTSHNHCGRLKDTPEDERTLQTPALHRPRRLRCRLVLACCLVHNGSDEARHAPATHLALAKALQLHTQG